MEDCLSAESLLSNRWLVSSSVLVISHKQNIFTVELMASGLCRKIIGRWRWMGRQGRLIQGFIFDEAEGVEGESSCLPVKDAGISQGGGKGLFTCTASFP